MIEMRNALLYATIVILAVSLIRLDLKVSKLVDQMNHNWDVQAEYDSHIYRILQEIAPGQSKDLLPVGAERAGLE